MTAGGLLIAGFYQRKIYPWQTAFFANLEHPRRDPDDSVEDAVSQALQTSRHSLRSPKAFMSPVTSHQDSSNMSQQSLNTINPVHLKVSEDYYDWIEYPLHLRFSQPRALEIH